MRQTKQDDERRKIQFTGGSTYIISLPKNWIEINRLKKGSYIKLREEGGLLTIVPSEAIVQEKSDKATIKAFSADDTESVLRKIVALYLSGYSSIFVKAEKQFSAKQRQEIKSFVRRLLVGTEIVLDTANQIVLQVLLTYPELMILNTLRRMSIITKSMHNDAILAIKTRDTQLANDVMLTDNEVDRFNLYVTRLLRSAVQNPRISKEIGLANSNDCLGYTIVTRLIERSADQAAFIAENSLSLRKELEPDIIEGIERLSSVAVGMFDVSMEALFRQDVKAAEKNIQKIKQFMVLERQAVTKADAEDFAHVHTLIEGLLRTAEYASGIAEIVLNLNTDAIVCDKTC